MKKQLSASLLLAILLPNLAQAHIWVKSEEGYDCKITCSEAGYITPFTDFYKGTDRKFYVCMSDVEGEGHRAGHSLSHEPGCFVAREGAQVQAMEFSCMCG
ncbi:MAG: hypothetical protein ACREGC_01515 [Minisyncoccia bacterium]